MMREKIKVKMQNKDLLIKNLIVVNKIISERERRWR